jgi:hypothetical protein
MKINLKEINIKAVINKCNGQINFSIPKKKVGKEIIERAYAGKPIKFLMEDLD